MLYNKHWHERKSLLHRNYFTPLYPHLTIYAIKRTFKKQITLIPARRDCLMFGFPIENKNCADVRQFETVNTFDLLAFLRQIFYKCKNTRCCLCFW